MTLCRVLPAKRRADYFRCFIVLTMISMMPLLPSPPRLLFMLLCRQIDDDMMSLSSAHFLHFHIDIIITIIFAAVIEEATMAFFLPSSMPTPPYRYIIFAAATALTPRWHFHAFSPPLDAFSAASFSPPPRQILRHAFSMPAAQR